MAGLKLLSALEGPLTKIKKRNSLLMGRPVCRNREGRQRLGHFYFCKKKDNCGQLFYQIAISNCFLQVVSVVLNPPFGFVPAYFSPSTNQLD